MGDILDDAKPNDSTPPQIDLRAIADACGLDDRDFAFAKEIIVGVPRNQAARKAGIQKEGLALRRKASEWAKTLRIQKFCDEVKKAGVVMPPRPPLDNKRRREMAAEIAETSKKNGERLRAIEIDAELEEREQGPGVTSDVDPVDVLDMIADISPLHAAALAHRYGCPVPEMSIQHIRRNHCPECARRLIDRLSAPHSTNGNVVTLPGVDGVDERDVVA